MYNIVSADEKEKEVWIKTFWTTSLEIARDKKIKIFVCFLLERKIDFQNWKMLNNNKRKPIMKIDSSQVELVVESKS